jgi:uncharacterized protein (TIRG00374 family)
LPTIVATRTPAEATSRQGSRVTTAAARVRFDAVHALLASASFGNSINSFFDAAGKFFASFAAIHWGALVLAMLFFVANLTLRSRAIFHTLRAAYPTQRFQWRRIWGAYIAAVGFNNVVPIRGGDVIKLYLTHASVPTSTYPAVAAAYLVEGIFDATIGVVVLIFAFTQGVFPKPPDFANLSSFDLSWLASNFRLTLFLITLLGVLVVAGFALLSRRVRMFWERVRQGLTILRDRRRYLREVYAVQFGAWLFRFAAFWALLDAFRVGGSLHNTLLVFGVNAVAAAFPFTPGGAGVQQALLVKVFSHTAAGATVAAYSVGQQVTIAATTAIVGFAALVLIFRFRSFKEVIRAGRESRAAEEAALRAVPIADPRAPRARA